MWLIGKYYDILCKGLKNLLVFLSSNQLVLEPIPYGQGVKMNAWTVA